MAEICSKCITTADPHPELFEFLYDSLVEYDNTSADPDFLIRFLVGLSHHLGFGFDASPTTWTEGYFDLGQGQLSTQGSSHLYLMSLDDYKLVTNIFSKKPATLPPGARRRITDQLITYYQLHVESLKEVNSIKVLRELF
jgi:DNA repair protein RecO (recombination protein O)